MEGNAERDAVRDVVERYAEATRTADVETLKKIFHPDAFMAGYLGDQFISGGPEPFFADLERNPSMAESGADYQSTISEIVAFPRTASAKLEDSGFFGSGRFVNFFHLIKVDGEWRITTKTFESL